MDDALAAKYEEMTNTPVKRLVLRMAGPTIISMMITALYNVVDAMFIGHLSTEATAGVGVAFAYMTFIQAIGFFFGHGSGNFISRALGAQQEADAGRMAAVGFITPLLLGSIVAIFALIFISPLSQALGATPDVVPQSNAYLRYIILATPFMMSALTLNNQLRLQGNARFAMVGIASGAVLNVALDPLFIFALGWGISGASAATAVSQLFSFLLLLWGTSRPGAVHIKLRNFRPSWYCYREILAGGLPSLFRQAFNCLSVILLNHAAARYALPGQEASSIAAFAIVSRIMHFGFSMVLGFDQGFQPVAGYNYGAHRYDRVRDAYLFAMGVSTLMLTLLGTIGFCLAPQIIALFRNEDPDLIAIGARALRWQCVAFPLVGLSTATNMLFQNIRMTFRSVLLSIGRQGLFFVPAIVILPQWWGLGGVEMTQAVADGLTFILSIPFAIWIVRRLTAMDKAEKQKKVSPA